MRPRRDAPAPHPPSLARSARPARLAVPARARTPSFALAAPLAALALLSPMGAAQRGDDDGSDAPARAADDAATEAAGDLPPVEPPPELDARQQAKLDRAIDKLRNSNAERRAKTEEDVIAFGRGAIPALLDAASTTHEGKQAGLVVCLAALVDLRDREIVAQSLASEEVVRRRFAAVAAGKLGLPDQLDALAPRLSDEDEIVRIEAALSLVTHGREEALPHLIAVYDSDWQPRVLAALPGVVDKGDHGALVARLDADPERQQLDPDAVAAEQLATVNMLHAIGDQHAIIALRRALDISNNLVQRGAINALRDILEDKPPLEAGSIFAQVAEVERLKQLGAGSRSPRDGGR